MPTATNIIREGVAQKRSRRLNGHHHITHLLEGQQFVNGVVHADGGELATRRERGRSGEHGSGMPDRIVGAFGGRATKMVHWLCCGTHGNMGLFYAWDGIIRFQDDTARVNLRLNRASPWMQIDSYLPYEGKVVLKNRVAKRALVRMPLWVDKQAVKCEGISGRVGPRLRA